MKPLQELHDVICKIGRLSHLTGNLTQWYRFFLPQIERLREVVHSPRVLRILAEETAFQALAILDCFQMAHRNIWNRYLSAVQAGEIYGLEYRRYEKCDVWMRRLQQSYQDEVPGPDGKCRRYAYAASAIPLPDWFLPEKIPDCLEEIITAYCLVWFSAMDLEMERRLNMNGYLTPEIEKAVAHLAQTCDALTREVLIRELTKKTQEWCKGDPEPADLLLEGKKTLEGCVKYVLEQAAIVSAKKVAAMPKAESNMLPTQIINGKKATMVGGAIAAEQVFGWARDYYYKVKEIAANVGKNKDTKARQKNGEKKGAAVQPAKDAAGAKASTDAVAAPETKTAGGIPEQLTLGGNQAAA